MIESCLSFIFHTICCFPAHKSPTTAKPTTAGLGNGPFSVILIGFLLASMGQVGGVSLWELKPAFQQQKLNINTHFIEGFKLVYSSDPSDRNAQYCFMISITMMLCGGFLSHLHPKPRFLHTKIFSENPLLVTRNNTSISQDRHKNAFRKGFSFYT